MAKLDEYKEKYQAALAAFAAQREKFNLWQKQFEGSKEIEGGRGASSVYNFTRELIEAQVDSSLPQPAVQPCKPSKKNRELATVITSMLRNELDRLPFESLNDMDERITRIMGGAVYLTEWDNAQRTHNTVGAVNVRLVAPAQFIPQEGVCDLAQMDYFFLVFDDTKSRIQARYGKAVQEEGADCSISTAGAAAFEELVTQKLCFYRNAKGGIGCVSWVGNTQLICDEHYFARKDKVCARCGKTRPQGERACACGGTSWEKRPQDCERLTADIVRADGTVIPAVSAARDEHGGYRMEPCEEPAIDWETGLPVVEYILQNGFPVGECPTTVCRQRPVYEATRLPYYYPKGFPVAIRKNISAYQAFFGDSDCAAIREQQVQANKALSKIDRKIAATAEFFTKPRDLNFKLSNDGVGVLNIDNPAQIQMIQARALEFGTIGEYNVIERAYYMAKSILGVTDTFQGKADPTATSGRAKEIQVAQAAGVQRSKRMMKNAAYAALFENIFRFMLAYADEPRTYATMDENGQPAEKVFNRYDFLEQDDCGNWYYNDEFLFSVDEAGAMQSDKQFLLEDVRTDFGMGAFGKPGESETMLMYWKEKEVLGYPNAKRMVKYWQEKAQQQNAAAQQAPGGLWEAQGMAEGALGIPGEAAEMAGEAAEMAGEAAGMAGEAAGMAGEVAGR